MTTPVPDLLRLAVRLRHFPHCTQPDTNQITGQRGDLGLKCRTCHSAWFPPVRLIEGLTETPGADPDDLPDDEPRPPARQLVVPGAPKPREPGWPTHKARARRRNR